MVCFTGVVIDDVFESIAKRPNTGPLVLGDVGWDVVEFYEIFVALGVADHEFFDELGERVGSGVVTKKINLILAIAGYYEFMVFEEQFD